MIEQILSALDEDQKKVVTHEGSNALVLAGAGSGKTRCLQHRVAYLLESTDLHPRRIAAISFTKKASTELRDRIASLHPRGNEVVSRTFHSFCYMLLRKQGLSRDGLISNGRAAGIIRKGFKEYKWRSEEPWTYITSVLGKAKMQALPRSEWRQFFMEYDPENGDLIDKIAKMYESEKKKRGEIDFADMLYLAWEAFKSPKHSTFLASVQRQFVHFIVDEAQDLNPLQLELAEMISAKHGNLMLVGDLRQSIYGFRGALPENVMSFVEKLSMDTLYLARNYRSCSEIVEMGNDLIAEGELESSFPRSVPMGSPGANVTCSSYWTAMHEAQSIARQCKDAIASGLPAEKIAVIYRVNAQSQYLQLAFGLMEVPFNVVGGMSFFDRKEVADAAAYLRLAADPTDADALRRIYNVPTRYLGRAFLDSFDSLHEAGQSVLTTLSDVAESQYRQRRNVDHLIRVIEDLQSYVDAGLNPGEILEKVYSIKSKLSHGKTFMELYKSDDDSDDSRVENLEAFRDMASQADSLEAFLESIESQSSISDDDDSQEGKVQFITVHRSKGLEFDTVFIAGMTEGNFPHAKGDLDEERRVAYVALTRAETNLHICVPQLRFDRAVEPSHFLGILGLSPVPVDVDLIEGLDEEA